MSETLRKKIKDCIPFDCSNQCSLSSYIVSHKSHVNKVLDLGCGNGNSLDMFMSINSHVDWFGLDIESSPEVASRTRTDCSFYSYDGVNIPFESNCFDMVYCRQVLEHVVYPNKLLLDVYRVLRPGGVFIGSVSQLEPYHSYSTFNYTPYGLEIMIRESGMILKEVRPGIDGITLLIRRLSKGRLFNKYFEKESPLNRLITLLGIITRKDHFYINSYKLLFAGHLIFLAYKDIYTLRKEG